MSEFCEGDFEVILYDEEEGIKAYPLSEVLPLRFKL